MLKRPLILLSLVLAYSLMLAHAVIPHHHHNTQQEADFHHQNEFLNHLPCKGTGETHGHTMHFVHLADFDTYLSPSSFKLINYSRFQLETVPFSSPEFSFQVLALANKMILLSEFSPPDKVCVSLPNGLRGSPTSVS